MRNTLRILSTFVIIFMTYGQIMAQYVHHERLISFEESVPSEFSIDEGNSLSISGRHFRDGKHSLCWNYTAGSELRYEKDLLFEPVDPTGKDTYLSCFILWVYNEVAKDEQIRFEFLKDGRTCSSFPMNINFSGWRGIWVCYERDMEGTPEPGMNALRITAPETDGTLWFDHLIPATKVDERQQTSDFQVPFVHKETNNHWLVIYPHYLYKPDIELIDVTEEHKADMRIMDERFLKQLYTPAKLTTKRMANIRERYDFYEIGYNDGQVYGKPIFFCRHSEAYERMIPGWSKDMFDHLGVEMRDYFDLMKLVSFAYLDAKEPELKQELREKFLAMYDNITDQGVAFGSCWGNIHHYGYSTRGMFISYYLMKDVLRETGRLEAAAKTLNWYGITNEIYPKPTVDGIDIDTFNTKLQGRFASILIMEDSPEKVQYLRSMQRWLNYGCHPAPGLSGSFKVDGACFHHCNNYPANAIGGLEGATQAIYLLHGTQFRLSELAHRTVKNVLLTMRFYCNLQQWPLSMSGRHPNSKGHLIPMQYATMALSGTPDGSEEVDAEMAEAYLRLVSGKAKEKDEGPEYIPVVSNKAELEMRAKLLNMGYEAEMDPQGTLALGYGCVAVHRQDNWMAAVRGHSRYLWAAEHYLPANFYGRYLGHGSMQIMTGDPDEDVTMKNGGWQEAGFDWNRIPGTTSIHLPFEKLRATISKVDLFSGIEEMLFSDEAFAGGLSHEGRDGNFGMKLHEHDKYNGSHRARKSYHFFGDLIVALGTDIENDNSDYPTETTIFQLAASTPKLQKFWDEFEYDGGNTWLTPFGVGYYVPKARMSETEMSQVRFEKNFPQITVGERSTKPTKGNWASLIINHGKAPKGASYEYAVLPKTNAKALKRFARRPHYKVLRQDSNAHIVSFDHGQTTSYVLFERPASLPKCSILMDADTSCLVMTSLLTKEKGKDNYKDQGKDQYKDKGQELHLTVSQPDLALYRGPSDEIYDENGKRIERSIYSRPWKDNESLPIPVTITLRGHWTPTHLPSNCTIISDITSNDCSGDCCAGSNITGNDGSDRNSSRTGNDSNARHTTTIRIICQHAASTDIVLTKSK